MAALLLVLATGAAGCEAAQYGVVRREQSIEACLRFLERYPRGARAQQTLRLLEQLRFEQAKRVDVSFGYRRFLDLHPRGRFSREARERLARSLLARAESRAELELILEGYPGTTATKSAKERLGRLLAQRAISAGNTVLLERFLVRFPKHPEAEPVAARLAALRYAALADDPAQIDRYLTRHPEGRWAELARQRLRALLLARIWRSKDPRLFEQFAARFPADEELPRLREALRRFRVHSAISRVDLRALRALEQQGPGGPSGDAEREDAALAAARKLIAWCEQREKRCGALRDMAQAARDWRPPGGVQRALREVYSADVLRSWQAIEALSHLRSAAAGERLWQLIGEDRVTAIWASAPALGRWLGQFDRQAHARWVSALLHRGGGSDGPVAERQRGAVETLGGVFNRGVARLQRLVGASEGDLPAAVLLVAVGASVPAVEQAVVRALRERVRVLESSFPQQPRGSAILTATMLERELFVLADLAQRIDGSSVAGRAGPDSPTGRLRSRIEVLLASWRQRLTEADSAFRPATRPSLVDVVARHRRKRAAVLRRLLRAGQMGRLVGHASCAVFVFGPDVRAERVDVRQLRRTCAASFPELKQAASRPPR